MRERGRYNEREGEREGVADIKVCERHRGK